MPDQRFWTWIGLAALTIAIGPPAPSAKEPEPAPPALDARALASRVDRHLAERWAEAGVIPAGPADDAEFLRRVWLDLAGQIPSAAEARAYLDDTAPDKRSGLVERLLGGPAYPARAADFWRQILLPGAGSEGRARFATPAFDAWLRGRVAEGAGYDRVVREILKARPAARETRRNHDLEGRSTRVTLGARLECAQCHDHPFDGWEREEFRGLAAFFAGDSIRGNGDAVDERAGDPVEARVEPREALAERITSPGTSDFARAAANRVWARFFGSGLVAEDGRQDSLSDSELLEVLAGEFASHGFEPKFLIRAITATRAYGLASASGRAGQPAPRLYSAMTVRKLSDRQLALSLEEAAGLRLAPDELAGTSTPDTYASRKGPIVPGRDLVEAGDTLGAVATAPFLDTAGRVEELYLAALARRPRPDELAMRVADIDRAGTPDGRSKALADVFLALLEGPEFPHNH